MSIFIIIFHVIAALTLILVVLLQAGSEAGLSGGLGGGTSSDSLLGTKSNSFLTKFTSVMAVIFMISSLTLAIIASKANKSLLLQQKEIPAAVKESMPVKAEPAKTEKPVTPETQNGK